MLWGDNSHAAKGPGVPEGIPVGCTNLILRGPRGSSRGCQGVRWDPWDPWDPWSYQPWVVALHVETLCGRNRRLAAAVTPDDCARMQKALAGMSEDLSLSEIVVGELIRKCPVPLDRSFRSNAYACSASSPCASLYNHPPPSRPCMKRRGAADLKAFPAVVCTG